MSVRLENVAYRGFLGVSEFLGGVGFYGKLGVERALAMDMVWPEPISHGFTVVNLKFPTVGLWEISLI